MPTPTDLPDTPNMISGNTRANAFGSGVAESAGINEIIADLLNAWEKLGTGATTPDAIHKMLKATAAGVTAWGYYGMAMLGSATGTGASGVLTFSSIPATFGALWLLIYGRSDTASTIVDVLLTLNGNTTAGDYDHQQGRVANTTFVGAESIGAAGNILVGYVPAASSTANLHASGQLLIPEYANTTGWKAIQGTSGGQFNIGSGDIRPSFWGGVFESTAAISSLSLTLSAGNWTTTSRATLLGLPAA